MQHNNSIPNSDVMHGHKVGGDMGRFGGDGGNGRLLALSIMFNIIEGETA